MQYHWLSQSNIIVVKLILATLVSIELSLVTCKSLIQVNEKSSLSMVVEDLSENIYRFVYPVPDECFKYYHTKIKEVMKFATTPSDTLFIICAPELPKLYWKKTILIRKGFCQEDFFCILLPTRNCFWRSVLRLDSHVDVVLLHKALVRNILNIF